MSSLNYVGKNLPRNDAYDKVTGRGVFTHDFSLPNMLFAKVLRSPYAHAKIIDIDTTEAEKLPGVKAVATYKNSPKTAFSTSAISVLTIPGQEPVLDQYIFDSKVRYIGDEVAAVAATTEEIAAAACKLIKVTYEELPAVFDPIEAMKPEAPLVHETPHRRNCPIPEIVIPKGDAPKAFEEAYVKADIQVKVPIQKHAQLESNTAVADFKGNGKLNIWSTTQTPHPTKYILGALFGMPMSKIRVQNPPYVGGGFGVRIGLSAKAEPIAALLSKLSGRPVKLEYDRHEDFTCSDTRHSGYVYCKIGADKDGIFQSFELGSFLNAGAYCTFSAGVPGVLGVMGINVYSCPNILYRGQSVYTNILPAGAMRGFGNPQSMSAVETAVDEIAKKLNMDPIVLREKNIVKVGGEWLHNYPINSTGLSECMQKAAESVRWAEKRGQKPTGNIRRGVGIGVGKHVSNAWPDCVDYDCAIIIMSSDGSINLQMGCPDIGTGTTTTLPQIAAEATGLKFENVHITFADSDATPFEIGSHASRSLYSAGTAVIEASKNIKKEVLEYASKMLEVKYEDLQLERGVITGGGKTWTIEELALRAHREGTQFIGVGRIIPPNSPPWHAHAAEVEVDIETGMVNVVKLAAAHDCGKAINPMIVEGQLEGGAVMGIGYATREEFSFDEKGKPYNDGFHKYMLLTAADVPEIDSIIVEANADNGPYGAKGVGECGLVPTAAAILSAVEDATGVRFYEFPLTPVRVLKGLREAGVVAE